jgi:hypothetical protein
VSGAGVGAVVTGTDVPPASEYCGKIFVDNKRLIRENNIFRPSSGGVKMSYNRPRQTYTDNRGGRGYDDNDNDDYDDYDGEDIDYYNSLGY